MFKCPSARDCPAQPKNTGISCSTSGHGAPCSVDICCDVPRTCRSASGKSATYAKEGASQDQQPTSTAAECEAACRADELCAVYSWSEDNGCVLWSADQAMAAGRFDPSTWVSLRKYESGLCSQCIVNGTPLPAPLFMHLDCNFFVRRLHQL